MTITEKLSYLKGLADGLKPDTEKPEGKLIVELLSAVYDMGQELASLRAEVTEMREYLEEMDEDLGDVESYLYDEDDDDDDDDDDEDLDDDTSYYEATCPSCGETVCFDDSMDPDDIVCPHCGESFGCTKEDEDEDEDE